MTDLPGFASPQDLAHEATRRAASGDLAGAEPLFSRLTELAPQEANAWAGLGRCRLGLGQTESAISPLRQAAVLAPGNAAAAINLAGGLTRLARHDEALVELDRAAALDPENAAIAFNRARALEALQRRAEAREAYDAALVRDPRLLPALVARAAMLAEDGERAAAIGDLDLALAQRPRDARLRLNRAMLALATGDWWSGLADHEIRLDLPHDSWRPALPVWRGEPLAGRHVLLFAEAADAGAAIGDTLQLLRFLPGLLANAGHVTVEVPEPLLHWPGTQALTAEPVPMIARGAPAGAADIAVSLLSLPHLCEAEPFGLPSSSAVVPQSVRAGGPVIGLAPWADGAASLRRMRDLPPASLDPLAAIEAARFVALQPVAGGPAWLAANDGGEAVDVTRMAELLGGVDLVIAADNWIAHLAGTLGVRTALLLDTAAEWRWLDQRPDTPWYPSVRIYRQTQRGDWAMPVAALARDLPGLVKR